jgi:AcrR family transcriptional regulator
VFARSQLQPLQAALGESPGDHAPSRSGLPGNRILRPAIPTPGKLPASLAAKISAVSEIEATVRQPKQQRSRESYERVLEAAFALLAENGFEGFTVQQVAGRASVSVGAIYERFGNKENLLRAAHARLMNKIAHPEQDASPEPSDGGVAPVVARWVRVIAYTLDEHRDVMRAFMHLGALDEIISSRGSLESIELSRSFKRALEPYSAEFSHPDPAVALDVAFRLIYCTLARQVMYGPMFESDVALDWERLTAELIDACVAYLLFRREELTERGGDAILPNQNLDSV